ncbi:MAG: DUF4919 domain-containing protein [Paludibacter sp.]|jgi:hypothetical protein|nr:DUF4919 domain-containing protein [Paludibacter sp.]
MRNKTKLLICILSILLSTSIYAQTKDSLELKVYVEKIIKDSSSNFYYPKLLGKVKNQPSDLSVDDCFFLYYGQIFQKGHVSLSFIANPEREKFDRAAMNGNCKKVIELGTIMLERNPVDLTVLLHVANCIKGKTDNYYFEERYRNLLSAIFSTGDGKSMKTSIRIVNMEDDYVLKGVLGFLGGEEKLGFENNHAYSIWEKGSDKLYFEDVMNIEK